jgi:hypothetical protein
MQLKKYLKTHKSPIDESGSSIDGVWGGGLTD